MKVSRMTWRPLSRFLQRPLPARLPAPFSTSMAARSHSPDTALAGLRAQRPIGGARNQRRKTRTQLRRRLYCLGDLVALAHPRCEAGPVGFAGSRYLPPQLRSSLMRLSSRFSN